MPPGGVEGGTLLMIVPHSDRVHTHRAPERSMCPAAVLPAPPRKSPERDTLRPDRAESEDSRFPRPATFARQAAEFPEESAEAERTASNSPCRPGAEGR